MAGSNDEYTPLGLPPVSDEYTPGATSVPADYTPGGPRGSVDTLAALYQLNTDLGDRNTVGDSAVGILDTLQSIGSILKAPLPGELNTLQQAGLNSQTLDEFRSNAYLAERQLSALTRDPDASFVEGAVNAIQDTLAGGNLVADVAAQSPYLLIGPAARAMGFAAATKVPGVLGKAVASVGGTSELATINRIAALSGVLEGAGGYSQTYQRAIAEGATEEEAIAQAEKAGVVSAVLGAALGRATPGFELSPTGRLAGNLLSRVSGVGGEMVEEGGLAIGQTVYDNILAGKDPMEGVGEQFGQAVAISSVFAGGMRAPGTILEVGKEIGTGVRRALAATSEFVQNRATTPQQAASDAAAEVVAEANAEASPEDVIQETVRQSVQEVQYDGGATPPVEGEGYDGSQPNIDPQVLGPNRPKSNSLAVENVLLNAQLEVVIENTEDPKKQARLLAAQEDFSPAVERAIVEVENLTEEAVAARVEKNDEQSRLVVEAVRLTDVSKLPDSVLNEDEQAIAETIREFKESGVDRTAQQIFESGFAGIRGSRGIRGFLQSILNHGRLIGDTVNEGSANLVRFVNVLEGRAKLFQVALDQVEAARANGIKTIEVTGTKTLDKNGNLVDVPFKLHVTSQNSIDVAERVIADAARARRALENARARFPGMFKGVAAAEVVTKLEAAPTPAAAIRAQVTPAATTAPAAPAPTSAPATVTEAAPVVEEKKVETAAPVAEASAELSIVEEAPVERTAPDLDANDEKAPGLYPKQRLEPGSTRIEDENGLIDVNMQGDTWVGTNTWNSSNGAKKGAGIARLMRVLQMAKLAGKQYKADKSVHKSAVRMYLRAIDAGQITAAFDGQQIPREADPQNPQSEVRKAIANALEEGDRIRREDGVFTNVQLVEQSTAEQSATPQRDDAILAALVNDPALNDEVASYDRELIDAIENGELAGRVNNLFASRTELQNEARAAAMLIQKAAPVNEAPQEAPPQEEPTPVTEPVTETEAAPVEVSLDQADDGWFERERLWSQEEVTEPAPAATEEAAVNPLVTAPLAEGQSWLNPDILKAFKIDPSKSLEKILEKLSAADRERWANTANYVMKKLDALLAKDLAKKWDRREELLKRPYGVFMHGVIQNADGSYEIHPILRQAFAYAAVMQGYRAPTRYDRSTLIDPETGLPIRAAQPHAWAREIARDAALILGLKPTGLESEGLTQGLMLSLGLSALQALVNGNDVLVEYVPTGEIIEATGKPKMMQVLITPDEVAAVAIDNIDFLNSVEAATGSPQEYTATLTPSDNVPERVNYSQTKTSEEQKTTIRNLNSVPHYLNPLFAAFIDQVDLPGLNRLLTGSFLHDGMPKEISEYVKSKIHGIKLEWNAIKYYRKMLGEGVENPLYWQYSVNVNSRYDSHLGPQNYTLIRDMFTSAKETVNLKDADAIKSLKIAIAQALNIKIDRAEEDILSDFNKIVEMDGEKAKKLVTAIRKGEKIFPILERGQAYKPRELAGWLTLGEMLLAQEAEAKAPTEGPLNYTSYLALEVDGKTNGAFNAEMFYGLGGTIYEVNLEQGGLMLRTEKATWGEKAKEFLTKYTAKDLYLRVASTAMPILKGNWSASLDKAKDPKKTKAFQEDQRKLLIATDMLNGEGTEFLREAAKRASNPTVYGAGVKGVASQLLADMRANLISKWIDLDYQMQKDPAKAASLRQQQIKIEEWLNADKFMWETTANVAAKALLNAYKTEKPNVSRVTEIMVQLTTLGFAVKMAQWNSQYEKAEKAEPRNEGIPDKEKRGNKDVTPRKWPPSLKEHQRMLRNTLSMRVGSSVNPEAVNLDDSESTTTEFEVEGLGTSFNASLDLPRPKPPGVRALALLTIGAGDAAMVTKFLQQFHAITEVHDGIEFKPSEARAGSVELNKAVWEANQHDVLADFVKLAENIRQEILALTPEQQQFLLKAYNEIVPEGAQAVSVYPDEVDADSTMPEEEKPMSIFELVLDTQRRIQNEHKAHQEGLAEIKSQPNVMLQMAYGPGYTTPVTAREAVATGDVRTNWNDGLDRMFQAIGDRADRETIRTMLDSVKWNRVQKFVWNRLKPFIPEGLSVTFARNAEEWLAATGKNDYGKSLGRTFIDGDRIVLATTSPSIILHEVMHATLTKLISNYSLNPASAPVEVRTALNNLTQLLTTFRALKDPRLEGVQAEIWKLQDVFGDTAAAIDEMMTWVLTDKRVMDAVSPGFVSRMFTRLKQVFWSFLGKEVPGTFLDEVINSFTKLTNDLITEGMGSYVAGVTRDAINDLDALTTRAYNALAQQLARYPNRRANAANLTAASLIDQIDQAFTLTPQQRDIFNRTFMLLRLNTRKGELEQFVSTALPKHPKANVFNGAKDLTASVLALAAVEPTFAAQLEAIYRSEREETTFVSGLIDKALDDNQHLRVNEMLSETFNAVIADSEYQLSGIGLATSRLDRLSSQMLNKLGEAADRAAENAPRGISDALAAIYSLTTEDGAEAFGRGLLSFVNAATNQRWLQDLGGALVGSQNDTNAVYRQVKRIKNVVAETRSDFTIILPKVLKTLFPEDFDGWNTLYEHVARLDIAVLGQDAALMFKSNEARQRMITALESKVVNHWDAKNLAYYMVHGTIPENTPHRLLRNARAIADNLNENPRKAADELVADVDQLVSLYAIDLLTASERAKVARYFTNHQQGMEKIIGLLQKVKAEEEKQYRDEFRYTYWKGEMPLTTDPRHSIVIAGRVKGAELEQLGYKRGEKYKQSADDPATDLFYYTRPYAPPPVFAQGIIATVQQTSMGINYTTAATITPEVGTMITSSRLVSYIEQNSGPGSKLIPIHNFKGEVVGYERLLDRKLVRAYTKSDNTLLHISIGQKLGRILEERWANTFNRQAIQILVDQWEAGKRLGIQNEYEAVNNTTDKQIARAWEVVPANIKRQLEDAFDGPVMIRRDLVINTLGYHNAGVGDVFTGDASLNDATRKFMMGLAQTIFMGPRAAQILYAAEAAIKEGVATARDWIIVRSFSVAYNNFMASINLVVANGVPLKSIAKFYRQGMQDVRVYSRLKAENIDLLVRIAGTEGAERERLLTLQKSKQAAMKRLSIYPLVEAGELSDLPEGLIESPDNSYLGDLSGWLNKKLALIHPKMPMIAANIAIAKDSAFHDTMSKAIQAGDFLARYAVYQHMVQMGMSPEAARDRVRDEFIAYAMNPGRARGYAENMGMIHWSQFTIRAQKVLLTRLRQNPFSFFVAQLGSTVSGTDGPLSMAITERGLDNSTGLDQVINSPTSHILSKLL